MLAKRIIPTLLHRGSSLVKGEKFDSWRSVGNVMQASKIYAARGVDELCILNIQATPDSARPDFELVQRITENNFTPISVGGGVKTIGDVRELLKSGADKVIIGTEAAIHPYFIKECANKFGSQAICVSVDTRKINGIWYVYFSCGKNVLFDWEDKPIPTFEFVQMCEKFGAGEVLLTAIDRDGTMSGYELELINAVSSRLTIPVIASGGCSGYSDMEAALNCGADAVAAGALFQFTDCTPRGAAEYLNSKGLTVRL